MRTIAFDTETRRISGAAVVPPIVCMTWAGRDENGQVFMGIAGKADAGDRLHHQCAELFGADVQLVGHNAAFDVAVVCKAFPDLYPAAYQAYAEGRIACTMVMEKLLAISTSGDLKFEMLPDGSQAHREYSLAFLEKRYIGRDRSAQKEGDDIWRLNYQSLETFESSTWPAEAIEYAKQDAEGALLVWEAQSALRTESGPRSANSFDVDCAADFALLRATDRGMKVDAVEWHRMREELGVQLGPEPMRPLIEAGFLILAQEGKPKKNGTFTKPQPEKIAEKKLREFVAQLCEQNGIKPFLSKKTQKPSLSEEALEPVAHLSPILLAYQKRAALRKLLTTELPRMCERDEKGEPIDGRVADVVHFNFDVAKETFRTSSYASDLYPSANGQNVDPRGRGCYVAREGHVLVSCDFSALELVSLADRLESLFGHSVLADQLRAGIDPHAALGARLAYNLDESFRTYCEQYQMGEEDVRRTFDQAAKHPEKSVQSWRKHYRNFAKPTGLGYPGGLGWKRFCGYAKNTFGVEVDEPMAKQLKAIWLQTYPEMRQYFEWVSQACRDPMNPILGFTEDVEGMDGRPIDGYCYEGPGGAYRAGCTYTACCNGMGLQTPAAIGAKIAVFDVQRAFDDHTRNSILYGSGGLVNFIHDELLPEIVDDDKRHERAYEVARLMVVAMGAALTRVPIKCAPAMMRRWSKDAEPKFDADGKLVPWEPTVLTIPEPQATGEVVLT